jgi:hypothetical protein
VTNVKGTRIQYTLPDGTRVQFRSWSDSGGATLEITFPNTTNPVKVHVE